MRKLAETKRGEVPPCASPLAGFRRPARGERGQDGGTPADPGSQAGDALPPRKTRGLGAPLWFPRGRPVVFRGWKTNMSWIHFPSFISA